MFQVNTGVPNFIAIADLAPEGLIRPAEQLFHILQRHIIAFQHIYLAGDLNLGDALAVIGEFQVFNTMKKFEFYTTFFQYQVKRSKYRIAHSCTHVVHD